MFECTDNTNFCFFCHLAEYDLLEKVMHSINEAQTYYFWKLKPTLKSLKPAVFSVATRGWALWLQKTFCLYRAFADMWAPTIWHKHVSHFGHDKYNDSVESKLVNGHLAGCNEEKTRTTSLVASGCWKLMAAVGTGLKMVSDPYLSLVKDHKHKPPCDCIGSPFPVLLPISYYLVSVSRQTWKTTGKSVNLLSLKAKEVFGPGATLQLISPSECSEPLLGFTGKLLFSWQPVAISCPLSWKNLNNVRMTSHEKPLKIFENACSLNSANTLVASHTE